MLSMNRATRQRYTQAPSQKAVSQGRGVLKRGHKGANVATLQNQLNAALGTKLKADGVLGPKTERALKQFQQKAGIGVDGVVGRQTLRALSQVDAFAGQGTRKSGQGAMRAPMAGQNQRPEGSVRAGDVRPAMPRRNNKGGKNLTATFDKVTKAGQRSQMVSGKITVNGNTYDFNSGGGGRGNLPAGNYKITKHLNSRSDKSTMMRDGVGYSFAMSDKYDKRVGGTRKLLRIHPDGGGKGTIGCIGIVGNGAVQRQFRADMNAELKRNGGSVNLRVG